MESQFQVPEFIPVNSNGHVGTVSSPHFFLGKLEQGVNQHFMHMLSLVIDKCFHL